MIDVDVDVDVVLSLLLYDYDIHHVSVEEVDYGVQMM